MIETNFLNNWKQFTIKKPDELILNHLDIVKNNTNLNGDLKHKKINEIVKVFSLFITHNYGSYIYELCHFLKYIKDLNLSLYEVMVLDSSSIIKQIKKHQFKKYNKLQDQMIIKLENYSFEINYSRVSTYLLMLDFIEEFLKLDEIYILDNKIDEIVSHNDLKEISNDLSKKIYNYLKNLIPSSYLQNISETIGSEIIKEKNNKNHIIVSEDISDEFIFNFWLNYSSNDNVLIVKKFSLVAELCMTYKKAVEINNTILTRFDNQSDQENSLKNITQKQVNNFLDQITNSSKNKILTSIETIEFYQNKKINILKKKELNELFIFSKYNDLAFELPLTVLRICVFGEIQSKIIEAQRRKKLNLDILYDKLQENLDYKNQYKIYKDLSENIDFIKGIIFYKLWLFKDETCLKFIRDFLSPLEIKTLENFLKDCKENLNFKDFETKNILNFIDNINNNNSLIENIEPKFGDILESYNSQNEFIDFKNHIEKLKSQTKKFRRNGFEFKNPSDKNVEILNILYESLLEIKVFLNHFLKTIFIKIKDLKFQCSIDKISFFEHFNTLYEGEKSQYVK